MSKRSLTLFLMMTALLFSGCGSDKNVAIEPETPDLPSEHAAPVNGTPPSSENTPSEQDNNSTEPEKPSAEPEQQNTEPAKNSEQDGSIQVIAKPDSITVLVNKQFKLPENYKPTDLVDPDVPFIFKEKLEKRKMRKEAAAALEAMFSGAKKDGINLAGVSAYRSHATQKALFNRYVQKDGEKKARTYSAVPGHSEHETGLAIDVTGSDGKCAAENCFAGTKEAEWIAEHAAEYGFIVRYPEGKEDITGYQYEPWHIRYVGTKTSKEIQEKGLTLEQYFDAVPVTE